MEIKRNSWKKYKISLSKCWQMVPLMVFFPLVKTICSERRSVHKDSGLNYPH